MQYFRNLHSTGLRFSRPLLTEHQGYHMHPGEQQGSQKLQMHWQFLLSPTAIDTLHYVCRLDLLKFFISYLFPRFDYLVRSPGDLGIPESFPTLADPRSMLLIGLFAYKCSYSKGSKHSQYSTLLQAYYPQSNQDHSGDSSPYYVLCRCFAFEIQSRICIN